MQKRFHSLAQEQSLYDDSDDIARREAIATEEQNYQELSQAEKRHAARIEALREDEVEEDDQIERKHHTLHKKAVKHGHHGKKHVAHHKPAHHKRQAHHQHEVKAAAPQAHQSAHKVVTADQAADRGYIPEAPGKVNSEAFTKGRFDSSESFAQHKRHHKKVQRPQALAHEEPSKAEQEAAADRELQAEMAKTAAEEKAKEIETKKRVAQQQYEERKAAANQYDGTVHVNGQRVHVDTGKVVGGVNNLAAKENDKKAGAQGNKNEAQAAIKKEQHNQKERIQKANYFDGLVHEPNGKMRFVDNGAEVSGVNTIAQVSSTSQKAHAHHKTAAKKHHGKKHHAKKMHPKKNKIHFSNVDEE